MTGSAQKCPNRVKGDQKEADGAKISISRTFGRRSLVDTSLRSQISCFSDYSTFVSFLRSPGVLKNAEIGFKWTERGQNGPKEVKRGQMRTNGARPFVLIRQVRFLLIFHICHTSQIKP